MKKYNYIYKITNIINGKIYIGKHSTDNIEDGYMGSGILINKAITNYAKENFTKEYIAFCDTEDKLNWFERFYIKKYHSRVENGNYNLTDGGDGGNGFRGKHHTKESKQKISISNQGKSHPTSEQTKQKISASNKGKPKSEEHKEKLRIATLKQIETQGHPSKGKHLSDETRKKISEHSNHKGDKNPMFGKKHPNRKKVKDVLTGVIYDSCKDACEANNKTGGWLYRKIEKGDFVYV